MQAPYHRSFSGVAACFKEDDIQKVCKFYTPE